MRSGIVASAVAALLGGSSIEAATAVFTGSLDEEPIRASFARDRVVLYEDGFRLTNGMTPYKDYLDHAVGPTGYSDSLLNFFPEYVRDLHHDIAAQIGKSDFEISITLDPESAPLLQHNNRQGQRFGLYLTFDGFSSPYVDYVIFGFDGNFGGGGPGNRPFALVGPGHYSYYIDPRDVTGTAETITLRRQGDVYQLYTSTHGTSFIGVAGQSTGGAVFADINGTQAVKPPGIQDLGPDLALTGIALWTESYGERPFPLDAGRIRSVAVRSPALARDINARSAVAENVAFGRAPAPDVRHLEGRVRDENGEPIFYAHVALERGDRRYVVITRQDGAYSIPYANDMIAGDVVSVTAKGFAPSLAVAAADAGDFVLNDLGVTLRVPGDYKTIQAALDHANAGDVIALSSGVYDEPFRLISDITLRGEPRTVFRGLAYRDVAITPYLAEYAPAYGQETVTLKAALDNVSFEGLLADGGESLESFPAEVLQERFAFLMAIDRVDVATVRSMLIANPTLAAVRYHTLDASITGSHYLTRALTPWVVRWTPQLRRDNAEIIRLLINHGADIEGFGGYAWSSQGRPLHVAASHGKAEAVRILLAAGADPNSTAQNGRRPIEWARGQGVGVADAARTLIEGGADYTLLDLLAFKLMDRLEAELGDRINDLFPTTDAEPTTLLHLAVRLNFPNEVRWLMDRGADPERIDANGVTPREIAVSLERADAVHRALGLRLVTR